MSTKNNYKILIIDDDLTLRLIAAKKLSQGGYHVITAGTGKEGIHVFLDQLPDLLLLDYELPDMTGVDVCRYLRSHVNCADKPILFITGKDDYQSIDNAFQAGATDFSRKPLNWTVLVYRIQYMLRAHEIYLSLLSSEERLTKAQTIAKIANWSYNPSSHTFKWSNTFYDILDIKPSQRENFNFQHFIQRVPKEDRKAVKEALEKCLNQHMSFELEHRLTTNKGDKILSHLGSVIKNDADEVVDCIGTLQDITERRHSEKRIRSLAYYDSLTGLMNREAFLTVLGEILTSNKSYDLLSALLFIDLDDFKRVNDTLGHDAGDILLCEVSDRLRACVRTAEKEKKYATVHNRLLQNSLPDGVFKVNDLDISRFDIGRLGGDEFTVFLADIPNEKVAMEVSKRLLKALEKPFNLNKHEVYITFSIGIAISPDDGEGIQVLLKNADTAMYSAKTNGKNNFQFYTQSMNEQSLYRLTLESDLRNAIHNNELYLVYQPQISLQTGRLTGAETLMRWNHKTKGNISPVEFIPLAEETGQILAIGDWLFEQFSKDLLEWQKQGLFLEGFRLALNLSALQFNQSDMIDKIAHVFSDIEINKFIEFELTESVMMNNVTTNLDKLNALVEHNITLSIDDFGTGYSSLSYLHRFPVDTVKIDRSFISNMENDGQTSIVKAIIAMAHGMNIKVVAEGIENQWQYDFLQEQDCDIGQGFFLYKPLDKETFQHVLEKYRDESEEN